jgi:transposase
VQIAVDTQHHLIVAHEVTNVGTDRHQLAYMAGQARDEMAVETLDAIADRGYFSGKEILECENASISVTLPKPMTSNSKAEGRFGKQDFRYVAEEDVYICPAGERLAYYCTTEDKGLVLRRYVCRNCAIKNACTTAKQRLISRWEHEHVLEAVQRRLDHNSDAMGVRRQTADRRSAHDGKGGRVAICALATNCGSEQTDEPRCAERSRLQRRPPQIRNRTRRGRIGGLREVYKIRVRSLVPDVAR